MQARSSNITKWLGQALLSIYLLTAVGTAANAQVSNLMINEIYSGQPLRPLGAYSFDFYPRQPTQGAADKVGIQIHQIAIGTPLQRDLLAAPKHTFGLSANYTLMQLQTEGNLPIPVQNDLHDIQFGLGYMYRFSKGYRLGGDLQFGTASDEPFQDGGDLTLNGNFALSIPNGENGWIIAINWSNNRSFLNFIPLPGIIYRYRASRRFTAMIGTPIIGFFTAPTDRLLINFFAIAPVRANLRINYFIWGPLRIFSATSWDQRTFFRASRTREDDLFFYSELQSSVGVSSPIGCGFALEASGGYSFFRSLFEGESYFDRTTSTFNLDDSFKLRFDLTYRFGAGGRPKP